VRLQLIVILCIVFSFNALCQKEADNWLYGNGARVNFSSGVPDVSNTHPQLIAGGCVTMSDKNGNLLFYGNGKYIYNRLHQKMPANLFGLWGFAGASGSPVLTVPFPGHDSLYYVFYAEYNPATNLVPRLMYSIINMNLDGGLGDITVKDQVIMQDSIAYKFSATLHCNKKDIWLIGHFKNSDKYYSLLITQNGINPSPVISTGAFIDQSHNYNQAGFMKVSPLGNKVASCFRGNVDMIELMDFNTQSGQLTNSRKLTTTPGWAQSMDNVSSIGPFCPEFSQSGNILYVSASYHLGNLVYPQLVYQFQLASDNQVVIQSTKTLIDSSNSNAFLGMQIANNGKIYIASGTDYLHTINNPEVIGTGCNLVPQNVNTGVGTNSFFDLPAFIQSYFRFPIITTGNCVFQNMSFSIENAVGISTISWDFGDPATGSDNTSSSFNPTHIFSSSGPYLVKAVLTNSNGCGADTITKLVHAGIFKVFLGNDTSICKGDSLKLKVVIPGTSVVWNTGTTDSVLSINETGLYWVRVKIGACEATDSIYVTVQDLPIFSLGADTTICDGLPLTLKPDNSLPGLNFLWSTGQNSNSISAHTEGSYWLMAEDNQGCRFRDTIEIDFNVYPEFSLGEDTAICSQTFSLGVNYPGGKYLWHSGDTTNSISISNSGIYWLEIDKNNCSFRDSVEIFMKPYPNVNLGADTVLCYGNSLSIALENNIVFYNWNTGSTLSSIMINSPGTYSVSGNLNDCIARDTIEVMYTTKPSFTLGQDLDICPGQVHNLVPDVFEGKYLSYLWSTGSEGKSININNPGIYNLELKNICGTYFDEIIVRPAKCNVYVPNAFTPNGDGLNDYFKPSFKGGLIKYSFQIFNRWGEKVFETRILDKGWDGRHKGKLIPGIYVFKLLFLPQGDTKEQMVTGTVSLVL
jgi:gliding motility-associated-like protein